MTSSSSQPSAPDSPGARRSSSGGWAMSEMPANGCALVTGSARGIGAATAAALADAGWPVGVNYRTDAGGAESVASAIEEAGGKAAAIGADVSDGDAID